MEKVRLSTEYIKLEQVLKLVGAVESGAEAKLYIAEGKVIVNGDVELKRGKKLRSGDIFEFHGMKYIIG